MNEMLKQYNEERVPQAQSLGLTQYRPLKRFRPANSGPERLAEIESAIRTAQTTWMGQPEVPPIVELPPADEAVTVEMATVNPVPVEDTPMAKAAKTPKVAKVKTPKVAKAAKTTTPVRRGRPPTNGATIAAKTQEFNDLAAVAKKKGVTWAKHHTSFFGSHTAADAQIKRLQDAIKGA